MEALVSIIVPVYNVEKYLKRSINSILNQTYENIEIILVDDGSKDSSSDICDIFSDKYSNIKVIHQKNAGLSAARNAGIKVAQGEWIALVDSDDYISKDFIIEMLDLCDKNSCDCAVCRYKITEKDHCTFETSKKYKVLSGYQAVIEQFGNKADIFTLAWNKLYHSSLFEGVTYPEGRINEDVFTTHELLFKANKVASSESRLYAYYQSPVSIMRQKFSIKRLDILEAYRYRIAYYEKKGEADIVDITRRVYCNRLFDAYWLCRRFLPEEKETLQNLRKMAKEEYRKVRKIGSYLDLTPKKHRLMRVKQIIGRYFPLIYKNVFVKDKNYI